ncbi:unnamed protein product [Camellia sinensis]
MKPHQINPQNQKSKPKPNSQTNAHLLILKPNFSPMLFQLPTSTSYTPTPHPRLLHACYTPRPTPAPAKAHACCTPRPTPAPAEDVLWPENSIAYGRKNSIACCTTLARQLQKSPLAENYGRNTPLALHLQPLDFQTHLCHFICKLTHATLSASSLVPPPPFKHSYYYSQTHPLQKLGR